MPDDVGQRLLHDPVGGHLDRGGERRQLAGHVDVDPQAAVGAAALGQPLQRPDQPELVERRRAQAVDQAADVGDRGPQLAAQLARQRVGRRRVAAGSGCAAAPVCTVSPASCGAEAVVQVAAQPAALLLAGGDQPLAGALQVGGQPHGGDGDAGLAGQVVEQPAVGGGEPSSPGRAAEHQLADRLALVAAAAALGGRRPGSPASTARRRRPLEPRSPAYGSRSASRDRRRRSPGSTASGASVPSSRSPRRASAAYGSSRSPYSSRLTARCSRSRSGANRTATRPVATSETAGRPRGATRRRGSRRPARRRRRPGGERAVDQRAVDDDVDAVEPVAQHRDRDRDRQPDSTTSSEQTAPTPPGQQVAERQGDQRRDGEEEPLHLLPLGAAGAAEPDDDRGDGRDGAERRTAR